MQIKTKLKIVSWVAAIMAIFILSLFAWTIKQSEQATARRGLIEEMVEIALKRTVLRDEYVLYHDERPKEQWLQQTDNLIKLFKRVQDGTASPDEKLSLPQISLGLDKTNKNINHLVKNQDEMIAGKISIAHGEEIESKLYSQLIIDAQSLITQILNLRRISAREDAARQFQSDVVILVTVLLMVCFTIVISMMVSRNITQPLNRLQEGIAVISTGNYDVTVGTDSRDEIGQLSRAFDNMSANLKETESGLKKAHEELESFAYSVSHDLRAPLRGIDGWSLALLEDYKDKLGEQGREYIDLVRSETQIMGRLIDDLLTFSRQSRADMNELPLEMTAMAHTIISRLQQQNPALQTDFIVQPGLRALGDSGLIEIALKNLLDNAAKFSSKRSHAVIEFGQVEKEGRKTFFVHDNGVGFDMAYANKLFGVFRRLHKASEFPGTGIGLASVQRIINRHGGRIWAEAKVNEGATFYFTLKEAT